MQTYRSITAARASRLATLHARTASAAHRRMIEHTMVLDALDQARTLAVPTTPTENYAIRVMALWDATLRALCRARDSGAIDEETFRAGWSERAAFLERHRGALLRGLRSAA